MRNFITIISIASLASACSFIARGPDQYKTDTRGEIEKTNTAVKSCYDQALASDANAGGKVTVNFTVEAQTGTFKSVEVDKGRTTAPDSLAQCVVDSINDLKLLPEDRRDGQATFTWVFQAGGGAPAA
jgi:hypothetical protein